MLKYITTALIITVALLSGCANTSQQRITPEEPLGVSVDEFRADMRQLQTNLEAGSPRELQSSEWREFNRIQQGFAQVLSDVGAVSELSSDDRQMVFNLQKELALLLGESSRSERADCARTTGSRLPCR
ncbi:MAG: hypothetical protein ACNA7J_14405, partial [Wenzhouxiangella sp.]